MPEYLKRFLDDAKTKPVVCSCCNYPAPVGERDLCEVCATSPVFNSDELDAAVGWLANRLLDEMNKLRRLIKVGEE